MKRKALFYLVTAAIFLGGCSSKNTFHPKEIAGEIRYDGELPSKIIDKSIISALLENREFITKKEGVVKRKLPKGYRVLNETDSGYIIANKAGDIEITNKDLKEIFKKSFKDIVASAAFNGRFLAIVFANNRLFLIDTQNDEVYFDNKLEPVYALDARIANPVFLNDLIIYPTLDGRLIITDINHRKILRDLVISNEKFFNNVIFLKVIGNRLLAATNSKVMSINPKSINIYALGDVRDILFLEDRVYIFTKDGRVVLADPDLHVIKERKFPFAIFSGYIYGEFIYLIEKGGYVIALDRDLRSVNFYRLPDKIEDLLFTAKERLYYQDKYFQLNTQK